ncbi:MAG: hypothetical protein KatS3mg098_150 [Candidatus Parcubacteria bacterium]|nr:30S ribosomal protein S20 [Patescibacteria group bacterium]BCX15921.1 MAG: hypothetical protein KatS3mg098_150 [Candidatus Parcubacteria bacterium]
MPVTKSAKKALRKNLRRRQLNLKRKAKIKESLKTLKKLIQAKKIEEAKEALNKVYKVADKVAKTGYIKKNKAARLKSRAAKLLQKASANI